MHAVDLVDGHDDRQAAVAEVREHGGVLRRVARRRDHEQHDVGGGDARRGFAVHRMAQPAAGRGAGARRVDQRDLESGPREDALDTVARRLRLVA